MVREGNGADDGVSRHASLIGRPAGRHVGRIGALAVALGIGGALGALSAVAHADTGERRDGGASASAQRSESRAGSGEATSSASVATQPRRSAGPRAVVTDRTAAESPAPAAAVRPAARMAAVVAAPDIADVTAAGVTPAPAAADVTSAAAEVDPAETDGRAAALVDDVIGLINDSDLAPIAGTLQTYVTDGAADWFANGTVAPEIDRLVSDPAVLSFVAGWAAQGAADLGLPPAVAGVVGTVAAGLLEDTFGGAGNADVRAAVDLFLSGLSGSPDQWAAGPGLATFLANPAVQQALGGAAAGAVGTLAGSSVVSAYVGDLIAQSVSPYLGGGAATAVGDAVAGLVPVLGGGLSAVTGTAITTFLGEAGVADALGGAAGQVLAAALDGASTSTAFWSVWPSLRNDPALTAALGVTLTAALDTVDAALLGDAAVAGALGEAVTALVTELAADPSARATLSALAAQALGGSAASVITGLLADPALAALAGSAVTGFLSYPGVSTALTDAAGQAALAALAGTDVSAALRAALLALQSDPSVQAALGATITGALQDLGGGSLGDTVTILVTQLASDPAFRAVIDEQLGAVLGEEVVALLGPLGEDLAGVLVPVITDLLDAPGVGTVLTGLVGDILAGADPALALQDALQAVQADPSLQDALAVALSGAVNSILGDEGVREVAGEAAGLAISGLLAEAGLAADVSATVSQVADVAVTALLGNPVVGDLIGDIAADILGGLPTEELAGVVIQTVLTNGALQSAVGSAIGQGIGSLLGDNIVGAIVGGVTGVAATLLIGLAAGLTLLFNPSLGAASSQRSPSPAAVVWWLPAAVA